MIHYGSDNPREIAADAIVLEVDGAGSCIRDSSLLAVESPSVLSTYRQAFDNGLVIDNKRVRTPRPAREANAILNPPGTLNNNPMMHGKIVFQ